MCSSDLGPTPGPAGQVSPFPLSGAESEPAGSEVLTYSCVPPLEKSQLQDSCTCPCAGEGPSTHMGAKSIRGPEAFGSGWGSVGEVVSPALSPPLSSWQVSFPPSPPGILAPGSQARVSQGPVWRRALLNILS